MIRFPVTRAIHPFQMFGGFLPLAAVVFIGMHAAPQLAGALGKAGNGSTALLIAVGTLAAWRLFRAIFRVTFGLIGLIFWAGVLGVLAWYVYGPRSIRSSVSPVASVIPSFRAEQSLNRTTRALRGSRSLPDSAYFPPNRGGGKFGGSTSLSLPAGLRRFVRIP